MKQEISAGGIVVRKKDKTWDVLLIKDMNDQWTFPKGLVEKGEEVLVAAKREMYEEVGISDVSFIKELTSIRYMYQRNGLISKTVHYFLFLSDGKEPLKGQKEEGISEVDWVPLDEAITIVGYPKTNKKLLEETQEILKKMTS